MNNSNTMQVMKINKSCFNIFPELESERLKYRQVTSADVVRERTIMKGKFEDDVILAILRKDYRL